MIVGRNLCVIELKEFSS